jgi:thiosulfate dehydrogenase [quinone] large subunit
MQIEFKGTRTRLAALVLLRILIGWHFLYEGIAKMIKPDWSAAGFLQQSKWIFSGIFKWMANNPDVLEVVDFLNIWGLTFIGLGLILGCFTRTAALAGMGLILLYYLCNPPFIGLYYSIPSEGNYLYVNKNIVEMGSLLVTFLFPTGKILGFDHLIIKILHPSRETEKAVV